MTTTIAPAAGNGALFTQGGVGAAPGYGALDRRRAVSPGMQAGVIGPTDFMVVQRAAGANLSVDITMPGGVNLGQPGGGGALVAGTAISGQGLYYVPVHNATVTETIGVADVTSPRVDQVILEVLDTLHDASGLNVARVRVLPGVPTAGATLANRAGAVGLPMSCIRLADVLVGAAVATIVNTVIRDRRSWARGAFNRILRTSGDMSTVSAVHVAGDAVNLNPRIECSGVPLRIATSMSGTNTVATAAIHVVPFIDGVPVDNLTTAQGPIYTQVAGASMDNDLSFAYVVLPTAGSHQFGIGFRAVGGGTAIIRGSATFPLLFTVEELVRQNTANNAVTAG